MMFVDSLGMFHVDAKEIPCVTGKGAPTVRTEGAPGVLYMDVVSGGLYKCRSADCMRGEYLWEQIGGASMEQIESAVWGYMTEHPEIGGNVDLTGYATERWVREAYQPKGTYLTAVPEDYATKAYVESRMTQIDQESIVQQVIVALGTPVFGTVDANNNIILSGSLADGTYMLKYEDADGEQVDIGTVVIGGPAYKNLFDQSKAVLNQRWSNSSGGFTASSGAGHVVSDYLAIPDISNADDEHILRFRGGSWAGQAGITYYSSSKEIIQASDASTSGSGVSVSTDTPTTDENGDFQITLGHKNGAYESKWANAAYIRVVLQINSTATEIVADDIQDVIITIDEPIVD